MMSKTGPPPQIIALDIATGNWKAQAIKAFITSNIAGVMEKLCLEENKFVSVEDISKEANVHPIATCRLLRFLSTFDVCIESSEEDKHFKLGPVGSVLTPNHPESVASAVVWEASITSVVSWDKLDEFLKTNKGRTDLWSYFNENPSILSMFQKAMTGYSNDEAFFLGSSDLSPTFDLSSYESVCDLGGAEGTLALMLTKRFSDCSYIISDLPECIARIDSESLPANFSTEAADFLKTTPKADAYLLKHIVHDWDDEHASKIFKNIHEANPNATIFVIEFGPMPGANIPHMSKGFDLHMGILLNASERTQEEYDCLYEENGYKRINLHFLAGGNHPLYVQEIKSKQIS